MLLLDGAQDYRITRYLTALRIFLFLNNLSRVNYKDHELQALQKQITYIIIVTNFACPHFGSESNS